jgi:CheY-like chemotaxis protein
MPRIAVVDDNASILELMAEIGRDHDWEILPVRDRYSVNDVAIHEQPDAVIFDFYPGTLNTRWELLRQLRTEPATASIPVIIWSTDTGQFAEKQEWLDVQHIAILSKPFELGDLYAHLDLLRVDNVRSRMGISDHGYAETARASAEYRVLVTNEQTGAEQDVSVYSSGPDDAQTDAVRWMFAQYQWRHCTASVPRRICQDG